MLPAQGFSRIAFVFFILSILIASCAQVPVEQTPAYERSITVYKLSTCECCSEWTDYLEDYGFEIQVEESVEIAAIKDQYQVPRALRSCHTALIDGYVLEGHVPVEEIERLLTERPDVIGLAVAGMPIGSPGMEIDGVDPVPYDVFTFDSNGETTIFASYPK